MSTELSAGSQEPQPSGPSAAGLPVDRLRGPGLVLGRAGTVAVRVLAEQLSSHGVPVVATDLDDELSGLAVPAEPDDDLLARARAAGQEWTPRGFLAQYFSVGGHEDALPLRVSVSSMGAELLSRYLGLNAAQAAALGQVFSYADRSGAPMLDLADLRAVLDHLCTAPADGVAPGADRPAPTLAAAVLETVTALGSDGADAAFGWPQLDTADLLRHVPDGHGLISLVGTAQLPRRTRLYSAVVLWVLADLLEHLPQDTDEAMRLAVLVDRAGLLLEGASEEDVAVVAAMLRMLGERGVTVCLVAESVADVPPGLLAELGWRLHVLDATGSEAELTLPAEDGGPGPSSRLRLPVPTSSPEPASPDLREGAVASSPVRRKYAARVERSEARDRLSEQLESGGARDGTAQVGTRVGIFGRASGRQVARGVLGVARH